MTSNKRKELKDRLARLEVREPPPPAGIGVPVPSSEELAAMSDEELKSLCEQVLATVELTPEELSMTADELHEHCCRLVKEDQIRAGLFN